MTATAAEILKEVMTQYDAYRADWIEAHGTPKGFDEWFTDQATGQVVKPVTYRNNVTAAHSGQINGTITAVKDDELVGWLDWQQFQSDVLIADIQVIEAHRRQGIGSELVRQLRAEWPGKRIDWGMMTPDGFALRQAVGDMT